jgi:hypothetical protein
MALTLALVLSCTGPILGSYSAGSLTADGAMQPQRAWVVLSLVLPFALFARPGY